MDAAKLTTNSPIRTLVRFHNRNGYLRRPNLDRREAESSTYKMGYEVRLVAYSEAEQAELRRAIRRAGLKPGKPFAKVNCWVQPIYGRKSMERFMKWLDQLGAAGPIADDS